MKCALSETLTCNIVSANGLMRQCYEDMKMLQWMIFSISPNSFLPEGKEEVGLISASKCPARVQRHREMHQMGLLSNLRVHTHTHACTQSVGSPLGGVPGQEARIVAAKHAKPCHCPCYKNSSSLCERRCAFLTTAWIKQLQSRLRKKKTFVYIYYVWTFCFRIWKNVDMLNVFRR